MIPVRIKDLSSFFVANLAINVFFRIFSAKSFFVPNILTIFAID